MKEGLTELVFILDESGSMESLVHDTIGGFNTMVEQQKQQEGECLVSTVLFNNQQKVLYDRIPIREIPKMSQKEYRPGGPTALLDAIGKAVHHIGNIHKYANDADRPEQTVFIITTDGQENASRHFNVDRVRYLVEHQRSKYGWEFLFLGADIDAIDVAHSYGIDTSRAARFHNDSQGISINFSVMNQAIHTIRSGKSLDQNWKSPIDKDYETREND